MTWKELEIEINASVKKEKRFNEDVHFTVINALGNFYRSENSEFKPLYPNELVEQLNVDVEELKKQRELENKEAQEFFFPEGE